MIKWLLKKLIWATEARKWQGMTHNDEIDVLHTFSNSCSTWLGPHLFLGHFYIIFWSFWEAHDFLKEAQSQNIKILYYFIVPWGTQRELVNTPWTHHVLHLFLVELGNSLFIGDLVHFGTLWLYWSTHCMLSSSQPLIRIFYLLILATRFESG